MSENRCVCCGEIIPEGRQCCEKCVAEYMEKERSAIFVAEAILKDGRREWTSGTLKAVTEWADKMRNSGKSNEIEIERAKGI